MLKIVFSFFMSLLCCHTLSAYSNTSNYFNNCPCNLDDCLELFLCDFSVGLRQDDLEWKTKKIKCSYANGQSKSSLHFKDLDSYTISAKAKWLGSGYYIRASGDLGFTWKGNSEEHFKVRSPILSHSVAVKDKSSVKRNSEVFDLNLAAGYPFRFCDCRLMIAPLIGVSMHRQQIRVRGPQESSYSSCSSSSCGCPCNGYCYEKSLSCHPCDCHLLKAKKLTKKKHHQNVALAAQRPELLRAITDFETENDAALNAAIANEGATGNNCSSSSSEGSSFYINSSSNPFNYYFTSNPFRSYPDSSKNNIAHQIGLEGPYRSSFYRFTWYGAYVGADIIYTLDDCWSLFAELEAHCLDRCNRKRRSWTGIESVDTYHNKASAYGFNGEVGLTYALPTCWYITLSVDIKYWTSNKKNDDLNWQSAGVNLGVGYSF